MLSIDEIKEILYNYYNVEDDYDAECGCYVNGNWISVADVLRVLERYS